MTRSRAKARASLSGGGGGSWSPACVSTRRAGPAPRPASARKKALSGSDLLGVMTYLLAKHPDTFPGMLDDAPSSVSPKNNG
jgi:hypothetical protein